MVEPDSPHLRIVQYHKVRWPSLADCVSRVVKLLPLLVRYFEEQAEDTQNRVAVRSKCRDLHVQLSMPEFQLYLYFLSPHLDLLSKVNKWLQSTNLTLHTVYYKIQALYKSFIAPVVLVITRAYLMRTCKNWTILFQIFLGLNFRNIFRTVKTMHYLLYTS